MLPSHNCIIIINVQFSRYMFESLFQETQWSISFKVLQSISWWRLAGSNRWPPACKAGALPAELNPHIFRSGGPKWTRFPAGKPRRLQQSTGLLPRAAFRVHFGSLHLPDSIVSVLTSYFNFLVKWWAKMDSNHRPHDYQSCALASWAIGPYQLPLS